MKECKTCINREYKDDLVCCQVNHLELAFRELLKNIPFFGKKVPDYECQTYEMDKELTGFPLHDPVNCRCSLVLPRVIHNED